MLKMMPTKVDLRAEDRFQENFLGQKSITYQLDLTSLLHLKVSIDYTKVDEKTCKFNSGEEG
jgi:hypothetical protein